VQATAFTLRAAVGLMTPFIPWHLNDSRVAEIWTSELDAVEVELLMPAAGHCDCVARVAGGNYCSVGKPYEIIELQRRRDGMPGQEL